MKLKAVLKNFNVHKLREIADFWNIPFPNLSDLSEEQKQAVIVETLYPRMQNQQYFSLAFKRLDNVEKDLIHFLAIHGGEMDREECLERFFHNDENRLIKVVNNLTNKGFVFFDRLVELDVDTVLIGIPDHYLRFIDLPSYWTGFLGYFLKDLSLYHLRAIVHVGLKTRVESNKKSYFFYKIRNFLLDPKQLQQYLESLPENEGKMFRKIVEKKGVVIFRDLLNGGAQKRYNHTKADYVNNLLSYSGLLYVAVPDSNKYNNLLMVPRDLMYIITHNYKRRDKRCIKELDVLTLPMEEQPPQYILENSNNILRDIVIFASFINRNALRVLSSGGIGKNDLKKVLPFMSAYKTLKYASFIALFCIQNKLIVDAGGIWKVSSDFENWLKNPHKCYTEILKFWLDTTAWNEEFIDGNVIHADTIPDNLVEIVTLRKLILQELENIPRNRWVYFKSFAETVLPKIEVQFPRRSGQYVLEKFNRSNYLTLESIIGENLYWLGLINLGLRKESDLQRLGNRTDVPLTTGQTTRRPPATMAKKPEEIICFFKLTDLGQFILEGNFLTPETLFENRTDYEVLPLTYEGEFIIVQPNLEVVVPPDFCLSDFYFLNRFTATTKLDIMTTLTISKESIRQALHQGLTAEQIINFLKTHSRQAIPDTVLHLIQECGEAQKGGFSIGVAGGYIRVEDPVQMAELLSHRKIKSLIREIIDEKLVLLNPDVSIKKLAKELQQLGFTPQLDTENIRQAPTGEYHIALGKEDLYNLIAILKLVAKLEKELKEDFTEKKVTSLIEQLKPAISEAYNIDQLAESTTKSIYKNFEQAFKKRVNELTSRYKRQLSKLMAVSVSRTPSKYTYSGKNPATAPEDMRGLLEYASENNLEVQISYKKSPDEIIEEIIEPESVDRLRLYGYCKTRDVYCVYSLNRITQATLL